MSAPVASTNLGKYESGNPVLQALIRRFQGRVTTLLADHAPRTALDVGCGEGFLARVLLDAKPGLALTGIDASAQAIAHASARCPEGTFRAASIESLAALEAQFDLVVCSEVLEHLPKPAPALELLRARCGGLALLTVPWEPLFQLSNLARGKYLKQLGNHPEHVQRWTHGGFVRFASTAFEPIHTETCFPWTIFLGRPRTRR